LGDSLRKVRCEKEPSCLLPHLLPLLPRGAAAAPPPKRYDEAFKRQAVENWIRSGRPGTQIARELGVS